MASIIERVFSLSKLPYGPARIQQTLELLREVEQEGPEEELPYALLTMVEAYDFGGETKRAMTTFVRLLRLWDTRPELFSAEDEQSLFWEFKWIAGSMSLFPNVTRKHAEAFFADMEHRYQVAGKGLCAPRAARFHYLANMNDPEAEAARKLWLSTPKDEFDDCPACIIGAEVDHLLNRREWQLAVETGERQTDECNIEPTLSNHLLTLAYLMIGEPEKAASAYRKANAGIANVFAAEGFTGVRGAVYEALGRGGAHRELLTQLARTDAKHLEFEEQTFGLLRFFLGLLAGLSAALRGGATPEQETGIHQAGLETLGALHAYVRKQAQQLSEAFDARAGNTGNMERFELALAAEPTAVPLPQDLTAAEHSAARMAQMLADRDPLTQLTALESEIAAAGAVDVSGAQGFGAAYLAIAAQLDAADDLHAATSCEAAVWLLRGDDPAAATQTVFNVLALMDPTSWGAADHAWQFACDALELLGVAVEAREARHLADTTAQSPTVAEIGAMFERFSLAAPQMQADPGILAKIFELSVATRSLETVADTQRATELSADLQQLLTRVEGAADAALEGASSNTDPSAVLCRGWQALGRSALLLGDESAAVTHFERCRAGFMSNGDAESARAVTTELLELLTKLGDHARATQLIAQTY